MKRGALMKRASRAQAELAAATLLRLAAGDGQLVAADLDDEAPTPEQDAAATALVAAVGPPPPGITWADWLARPWDTAGRYVRDEARAYAAAAADVIEAWGQPTIDFIAANGDRAVEYAIEQAPDVAEVIVVSYEILTPVREDLERAADRLLREAGDVRDDAMGFGFLGVAALAIFGITLIGLSGAYVAGPGSLGPVVRGAARV